MPYRRSHVRSVAGAMPSIRATAATDRCGFACALGTAGHSLGFHRTIVVAADVPSKPHTPHLTPP